VDETLRRLLLGQLPGGELPHLLDLSALQPALAQLIQNSLGLAPPCPVPLPPGPGPRNEWGACIVLDGNTVRLEHVCEGDPQGVQPPPQCLPDGHQPLLYVGYAHTHPPDPQGVPYPGFSELDYSATLTDGDNLALACNGIEVFALVRTKDRTQPRRLPDDVEFADWQQLRTGLLATCTSSAAALWEFNRTMCARLGFALYYGRWGQPLACVFRP
jgi:hypothetical protein